MIKKTEEIDIHEQNCYSEDYYFRIDETDSNKVFCLIIYDIEDNKKRRKLAKYLNKYGVRTQKSAFEAIITSRQYEEIRKCLAQYVNNQDNDSIRIYKIIGKGQVTCYGKSHEISDETIVIV